MTLLQVLPDQPMEDQREVLLRELVDPLQTVRDRHISAGLQLVVVELAVRELEDGGMRAEVLDQFDDPE